MANRPKLRWGIFLVIALAALVLRLPALGVRPMHTDESVNAYIVGQLLTGAAFHYDPVDRHGPALAAFALPLARLEGVKNFAGLTESGLRLASVIAGTTTVLLFAAAVEPFGFLPCLVAALLFAFAPLPVYYSRDFIHETLFVTATLALICAGWRAARHQTILSAAIAGACAALMLATKETAVLHFAAIGLSILIAWLISRKSNATPIRISSRMIAVALSSFLLISILLFTWFGRNWSAVADLVHILPDTLVRAGGQGHEKPFWYYFTLLAGGRSGIPLLIFACVGVCLLSNLASRWIAIYLLLITLIYCAIPYKTPWLALNLWLPIVLLAGLGVNALWNFANSRVIRIAIATCLVVIGILIAHDTEVRAFMDPAGETNPYAYVQTSEDLLGLPERLDELMRQRNLANPRIAVIASDPWPLPWYLRKYPQTGFWKPGQQTSTADFYISSTTDTNVVQDQFKSFNPEFFGLRTNVLIILWVPPEK